MKDAVVTLIKKADEIKLSAEEIKKRELSRIEEHYNERARESYNLVLAAQSICDHPEERKEFYEDYHKNEKGYEVYCNLCGKYLRTE